MYFISITTLAFICHAVAITTPPADWILGLRESVHQALIREHRTNPDLHHQILTAPILGHQSNPPPFGDIVVLGRGQFYATPHGFKFILDNPEACDCHGNRCKRSYCQPWKALGPKKLLALWTAKKIRHRDSQGHFYEIEYTISPITHLISDDMLIRADGFNYNLPGHIFVSKSARTSKSDNNLNLEGYKNVLHKYPGFYTSFHDHTTTDPKEYELYKKLIESLAAKTTHRFQTPTKPTYEHTYFQLVPVTSPVNLVPSTTYSEPDLYQNQLPSVTPEPPKPITMPVTTVHYYTPVAKPSTTIRPTTEEEFDLFGDRTEKTIEQLPTPPETVTQTTVPYTRHTSPTTTTQKLTTPIKTTIFIPVTTEKEVPTKTTTVFIPTTNAMRTTTFFIPASTTTQKFVPTTYVPSTTKQVPTTTQFIPSTQAFTSNKPASTITEFYFDSTTGKPAGTTYTVPVTTTYVTSKTSPTTIGTTYKIPITTTFNPETTQIFEGSTVQMFPSTLTEVTTQNFATTGVLTVPDRSTTTQTTTTTAKQENFLIEPDTDSKPSTVFQNHNKDFTNDDIFGPEKRAKSTTQSTTTKKTTQSDISESLFGTRESKQLPLTTTTPKIIFNNFYAASTDSPGTTFIDTTNGIIVETTRAIPSTDQSFSTSVSFEVNKRNDTVEKLHLEKPQEAEVKEILNHSGDYKIYKAEDPGTDVPKTTTTPTIGDEVKKKETKKVMDDFALQLVNHAKGIDYLSKKNARQAKYRKRNYVGRGKITRMRKTNTQNDK